MKLLWPIKRAPILLQVKHHSSEIDWLRGTLIEIYWGLSTAKYSSASHPSLEVLQYYTFLTVVVKCSTGVPLKRECEVLKYLVVVLSSQYISISVVAPLETNVSGKFPH